MSHVILTIPPFGGYLSLVSQDFCVKFESPILTPYGNTQRTMPYV